MESAPVHQSLKENVLEGSVLGSIWYHNWFWVYPNTSNSAWMIMIMLRLKALFKNSHIFLFTDCYRLTGTGPILGSSLGGIPNGHLIGVNNGVLEAESCSGGSWQGAAGIAGWAVLGEAPEQRGAQGVVRRWVLECKWPQVLRHLPLHYWVLDLFDTIC